MLNQIFGGKRPGNTRNIKLEGAALAAVQEYEAFVKSLEEQRKAACGKMWEVINRETGTSKDDDLSIDREYLPEFGIAILKVSIEDEGQNVAGTGAAMEKVGMLGVDNPVTLGAPDAPPAPEALPVDTAVPVPAEPVPA